jgi:hypothetical protein
MANYSDLLLSQQSKTNRELDLFNVAQRRRQLLGPKLLGSTGYTPTEQQGMKVATSAPITSAFSSAGDEIRRQAARTGTGTSFAPAMTQLAQKRGLTLAPALAGLQQQFGDARREDEKYNVGLTQSDYQATTGNLQNSTQIRAGLGGQLSNLASAQEGKPSLLKQMAGGAFSAVAPSLIDAGLEKAGIIKKAGDVAKTAAKTIAPGLFGASPGIIGAGLSGGAITGLPGAGAAMGLTGASATMTPGVVAGGGGFGPALAAFATNPITLGVAAAIGGALIAKKLIGRGRKQANNLTDRETGAQGQFAVFMEDIAGMEGRGEIDQEQRKGALNYYFENETIPMALQFAQGGKYQRKVVTQMLSGMTNDSRWQQGHPELSAIARRYLDQLMMRPTGASGFAQGAA